jgi:hypothetical protein
MTEALSLRPVLGPALAHQPEHLPSARPPVLLEGRLAIVAERLAPLEEPDPELDDGPPRDVVGSHRARVYR